MKAAKEKQLDPLYVIFEQHLYHFQDDAMDRKAFIDHVLQDYLSYLRKLNITVPKSMEKCILEELEDQVRVMLTKKIYGCLSIKDFQDQLPKGMKRKAKSRYSQMTSKKKVLE